MSTPKFFVNYVYAFKNLCITKKILLDPDVEKFVQTLQDVVNDLGNKLIDACG